jgi:hypothetical protein
MKIIQQQLSSPPPAFALHDDETDSKGFFTTSAATGAFRGKREELDEIWSLMTSTKFTNMKSVREKKIISNLCTPPMI